MRTIPITTGIVHHDTPAQRLSHLEGSMYIILQDKALLIDIPEQPYPSDVNQSTVNLYCSVSPQDTTGSLPVEYVCFYSIPFQILKLNVPLDSHVPCGIINLTIISYHI